MPAAYRNHDVDYYSNANVVLPKPDGTLEGDIMFAVFVGSDGLRTVTTIPSGWEVLQFDTNTVGNSRGAWTFWKKAGAGEGNSYTFGFNFAFNGQAGIISYSNGNTVNISGEQTWSAMEAGPWSPTAPSITTTENNCLDVYIVALRWTPAAVAPDFTEPVGYTERIDAGSEFWNVAFSVADKVQVTAGASGAATGGASNASATLGSVYTVHVAISPIEVPPEPSSGKQHNRIAVGLGFGL